MILKKAFKYCSIYFFILSIFIILINYLGLDYKNFLLVGLNPIIYILLNLKIVNITESIFNIYIIHLITYTLYGFILDVLIHGTIYIIKNLRKYLKS